MPTKRPKKIEYLIERIKSCIATGTFRDTFHAALRKNERNITLPEIIYVLTNGRHEKSKDRFDEAFKAWNYAVLRVIVSFDDERDLLIITAFYIEQRR